MTTLIAWTSYSNTGQSPHLPRAIYVASDSRITWGSAASRWEAGRKVFTPLKEPHIFGYCGDVVFPSLVLGQVIAAIDCGVLFAPESNANEKNEVIFDTIKASHERRFNVPEQSFQILHVHRTQNWPSTNYVAWLISYDSATNSWSCSQVTIPSRTGIVIALGTGASAAKSHASKWAGSDVGGTSRAIFSAFCDAVISGNDPLSGGTPQIAALYTKNAPRPLGYVENGLTFLNGLQLGPSGALINIEWRDRLFQRVDPSMLSPIEGARRFARPTIK
jgi:hypothetical protein